MSALTKILLGILIALVVLLGSAYLGARFFLKSMLTSPEFRTQITRYVETNLRGVIAEPEVELGPMSLSGFRFLEIRQINVTDRSRKNPQVLSINNLKVEFAAGPLLFEDLLQTRFTGSTTLGAPFEGSLQLAQFSGRQKMETFRLQMKPVLLRRVFEAMALPRNNKGLGLLVKHLTGRVTLTYAETDKPPAVVKLEVSEAKLEKMHPALSGMTVEPFTIELAIDPPTYQFKQPVPIKTKVFTVEYSGSLTRRGKRTLQKLQVRTRANPVLSAFYAKSMGCPKERVNFGQIFGKSVVRHYIVTGDFKRPKCRKVNK